MIHKSPFMFSIGFHFSLHHVSNTDITVFGLEMLILDLKKTCCGKVFIVLTESIKHFCLVFWSNILENIIFEPWINPHLARLIKNSSMPTRCNHFSFFPKISNFA
jgi:hypothetical protein